MSNPAPGQNTPYSRKRAFRMIDTIQPPLGAEETLERFIHNRPIRTRRLDRSQDFIGQWGEPGGRATCSIASRLNGMIGLGALTTREASSAHDQIAGGRALGWMPFEKLNLIFPLYSHDHFLRVLNDAIAPNAEIEMSSLVGIRALKQVAAVDYLAQAAEADISVVLELDSLYHAVIASPVKGGVGMFTVVDSRLPHEPRTQEPGELVRMLDKAGNSDLQLLYDVPLT